MNIIFDFKIFLNKDMEDHQDIFLIYSRVLTKIKIIKIAHI